MATAYPFDGCLVEMHHAPDQAKTDAKQQLNPSQLRTLLQSIRGNAYNETQNGGAT